jgi:hypothetical protein
MGFLEGFTPKGRKICQALYWVGSAGHGKAAHVLDLCTSFGTKVW